MGIPASKLMRKRNPNWWTICEVLREAYELTEDPGIRELLEVALVMAKKMDRRLKDYRESWSRDEWMAKAGQEPAGGGDGEV